MKKLLGGAILAIVLSALQYTAEAQNSGTACLTPTGPGIMVITVVNGFTTGTCKYLPTSHTLGGSGSNSASGKNAAVIGGIYVSSCTNFQSSGKIDIFDQPKQTINLGACSIGAAAPYPDYLVLTTGSTINFMCPNATSPAATFTGPGKFIANSSTSCGGGAKGGPNWWNIFEIDIVASSTTLTSISPNPVFVGSPITLTGTNFTSSGNDVQFIGIGAGTHLVNQVDSPTSITGTIPAGSPAGTWYVQIVNGSNQLTNALSFTVKDGKAALTFRHMRRRYAICHL